MMKNLRKNALISLFIVLAIIVLFSRGVRATDSLLVYGSGDNTAVQNQATDTTNTAQQNAVLNTVTNELSTNVLGTTNTVQKVNNINDASKDIPQTGENDLYIISLIGMVAIVIGGVAFAKSKKYDI